MIRINDIHSIKNIAHMANIRFVPAGSHCIAQYDKRDVLMGGCLLTDWNVGSIQMHIALWGGFGAMRPLIWLGFQYPFVQLGVKKVFGLVPEWNWRARNLDVHLGFRIEYLVDDVYAFKDKPNGLYILSMRKEDCRWLSMKCPPIEYAPAMFTDRMDKLWEMPTVGGMQ